MAITVINAWGLEVDFDAAIALMDHHLREMMHNTFGPCKPQLFFGFYCRLHRAKFGEEFEPNKRNPVW